jgi:hypothetical protein
MDGDCTAVLRRAISAAWWRVWVWKKGETGKEEEAVYIGSGIVGFRQGVKRI